MSSSKRIGILCGGGPAPGINSVIGAATIRSVLGSADVLGISRATADRYWADEMRALQEAVLAGEIAAEGVALS